MAIYLGYIMVVDIIMSSTYPIGELNSNSTNSPWNNLERLNSRRTPGVSLGEVGNEGRHTPPVRSFAPPT
eukprot:4811877-Pyramimonas_sp.AAC.1